MSKPFHLKTEYADEMATIVVSKYENGTTAAYCVGREGPICKISVNLVDLKLDEGFIFVKDYAENEGLLECLLRAGMLELVPEGVGGVSGFCEYPICKLTEKALEK